MSRRRFVWDKEAQKLVELTADWAPSPRLEIVTDGHYEGARAVDGEDISTRRRHREYMQRHGVTVADDFKGEWAQKAQERERFYAGDFDKKARTEAVERAIYQVESGQGRRR